MAAGSTSSTSSPTAGSKSSLSHDVPQSRPLISGRFDPNDYFVSRLLPSNELEGKPPIVPRSSQQLRNESYQRLLEIFGKVQCAGSYIKEEITWSAEENSERRKRELKKSSEKSVIVDTETRSGTKTADSSNGEDGGGQPPKTETDVRNEARRGACVKRKRNQEIQAEKMVRLRNKTLQHVTPGTVVSMKMDPRDVKRARGLLGIVCDRSGNRAGGVQVERVLHTLRPLCCAKSAGSGIA
ncbi:hypothetical protein IV203_011461 [Nitzschia inconspicua]|uniref:Uncharacterized protein n=1 Tax=Nitzschia inconspicua TaxID=303405 RepID=A0A9K3KT77_9STRA|nr:hypothetical protein IV203_011461 [Nitzschia inconspicua]